MSKLQKNRTQVEKLKNIKLPEQRSPEWYKMRENMITASDFGAILGNSKYDSRNSVLKKKCGLGPPFQGNKFTKWGVKYEEVATDIYRYLNKTDVLEFGCIPHPNYSYLGASPDGITPDGVMLEIKVPYSREFEKDNIPPHYYDQMQGQLEVCDLDECDFLQVKLEEYSDVKEYEPREALTDNLDGLEFYRVFSKKFDTMIKIDGALIVETGKDEHPLEAKKIFEQSGPVNVEMINDYNGDIRVLKVMKC